LTDAIKGDASVDDVEDVLALLLLTDPKDVGDEARTLLDRFAKRAGIEAGLDASQLTDAVGAYLERKPVNAGVVARLKKIAGGLMKRGQPTSSDVQRALAAVGREHASTSPLGGGVRPKGTIAAGPFARAALTSRKS
jgi:hypothetical protein